MNAMKWFVVGSLVAGFCLSGRVMARGIESQNNFKMPKYEKVVLKNGLSVYLMEQHEVPLIYLSTVFPVGAVLDQDKKGLAFLTAEGLLFGTKNYEKQKIEEIFDFIGAGFGTSAGSEMTEVSLSVVNKDLDKVLPIFKEILMHPTFNAQEFEKRKTRLLSELDLAKESPRQVIGDYFNQFLFGSLGYGNPIEGTKESVAKVTESDLQQFYNAYYSPQNAALAVVGDFDTKTMRKKITDLFKDWNKKRLGESPKQLVFSPISQSRVLLVNKDDASETSFSIGGPGIKRNNPDYVPVQVINTILGGRFTSWLNDELRVNRGLTYGIRSSFAARRDAGTFVISSFTRTATTIEALDVTMEVYQRLLQRGVDEATLKSAQNYIKGQFPPRYETSGSLASLLTSMFIYDFDDTFINEFQSQVDQMTVATAKDIIAKYFPADHLQFVLIGKADELRESVKKYGQLLEKDIKSDGY